MPNNNEIPTGRSGQGDDEWNDFVRRFEAEDSGLQSAPRPRRAWPLNLALALVAAGAAFAVLKYTGVSPDAGDGAAAPAPAASTPARATSAAPSTAPSRGTAAVAADTRPMVPLAELFPAQVKGASGATFTRLGSTVMESCTERDGVGPRLAAMIDDSAGCVGEQIALYKDDRNNQFNMAVFSSWTV
ncbi:hypothetical protein ACGFYQ_30135 [Streptomyces sp. NPDC048258]|uniref:hypothetical protein n=1 Tax=Streptomyces sp. NPDC048258 TaxID=3365527 RepID=UPI00371BFDED